MSLEDELRKLHKFMTEGREDTIDIDEVVNELKGLPVSKYGLEAVAYLLDRYYLRDYKGNILEKINGFPVELDEITNIYKYIIQFEKISPEKIEDFLSSFYFLNYFNEDNMGLAPDLVNLFIDDNLNPDRIEDMKKLHYTDYTLLLMERIKNNKKSILEFQDLLEYHNNLGQILKDNISLLDKSNIDNLENNYFQNRFKTLSNSSESLKEFIDSIPESKLKESIIYYKMNKLIRSESFYYLNDYKKFNENTDPNLIKYESFNDFSPGELEKLEKLTQFIKKCDFFLPKNTRELQIAIGTRWAEYMGYEKVDKPIVSPEFYKNINEIYNILTNPNIRKFRGIKNLYELNKKEIIGLGRIVSTTNLKDRRSFEKLNAYLEIISKFENKENISVEIIKNPIEFSDNINKYFNNDYTNPKYKKDHNYEEIYQFSKYQFEGEFLEILGEGLSSNVYLVKKRNMKYPAALKIYKYIDTLDSFSFPIVGDEEYDENIRDKRTREYNKNQNMKKFESQIMDILRNNPHKNIVKLYDAGNNLVENITENYKSYAILMEYVDGETLENKLENGFSLQNANELSIQLLDAITHIKGLGIYHRDIHDRNVKINSKGVLKIMDFGEAKTNKQPYEKNRRYGGDSDYFSWALLTYGMFTGEHLICKKENMTTNTWADRIKELKKEMRDDEGKLKQEYVDKIQDNMPFEYHTVLINALEYNGEGETPEIIKQFNETQKFIIEKEFYKKIGLDITKEQYKEIKKRK